MTRRIEIKEDLESAGISADGKRYIPKKRWKMVSPGTHVQNLVLTNQTVMNAYLAIVQVLKKHFLESGTVYFERDYRDDNIDPFSCYAFAFEHGYMNLECDVVCVMQVHYDFTGYAKEAEVKKLFRLLDSFELSFHKPKTPDMPSHFKGIVAYQDKQFIHTI